MYSYQNLLADLDEIRLLPGVEIFSIGKSVMGKEIPCIQIGSGGVRIQVNAAHHAIESITSALAVNFCKRLTAQENVWYGYNTKEILAHAAYSVIPMVNPDGVELAAEEIPRESIWYKRLQNDMGAIDFSQVWSANINGCLLYTSAAFACDGDNVVRFFVRSVCQKCVVFGFVHNIAGIVRRCV